MGELAKEGGAWEAWAIGFMVVAGWWGRGGRLLMEESPDRAGGRNSHGLPWFALREGDRWREREPAFESF